MKRNRQPIQILIVTAAFFALAGATLAGAAEAVAQLDDSLYLGKPVVAENVTVWPVYSSKAQEAVGEYMTLPQAQEKNLAVVRETGAAPQAVAAANPNNVQQLLQAADVGGQVNQLVIENKGEKSILVLAGTLLKGGNQDRQIAQDFIIPPGKTVPVGAFCVEHGRWTANREGVSNSGMFVGQNLLAQKEVRDKAQYVGDQQLVWDNVAAANRSNSQAPATGTLLASVEKVDKDALARRERIKKAVAEKFAELAKAPDAPLGLAYAVDGKIREIRTFAHSKIWDMYVDMLLNTVAMEGDQAQRKALAANKDVFSKPAEPQQAVELVKNAEQLKDEVQEFAGNRNSYRKDAKVWNGNCLTKPGMAGEVAAPVSQSFQPAE